MRSIARGGGLLLPLLALAGGCATNPSAHENIVQVSTFYRQRPWLNFDVIPRKVPGGFAFALYLKPNDGEKGVFGDGTIHVEMYLADGDIEDGRARTPIKTWSFDTGQARIYRATHKTRLGWGYGLRLDWGDADVLGREIMIVVSFERKDGRFIRGRPKYFEVPQSV